MDGEPANVGETPGHPVRIRACWRRRPSQGSLDGQMLFATILDEGKELSEELLGPSKPVAKGAPYGQVIGEGLTEDVHAASPGQVRAIVRKVSRSTLA
jgi:hypothetical protein